MGGVWDAQVSLTDSSYVVLEPHSQGCGGLARVFWVLRGQQVANNPAWCLFSTPETSQSVGKAALRGELRVQEVEGSHPLGWFLHPPKEYAAFWRGFILPQMFESSPANQRGESVCLCVAIKSVIVRGEGLQVEKTG